MGSIPGKERSMNKGKKQGMYIKERVVKFKVQTLTYDTVQVGYCCVFCNKSPPNSAAETAIILLPVMVSVGQELGRS